MRDNHGRESDMTIHCPHCLTGYVLPERLLGAGGARVRCPGCQEVFIVLPEGEAAGEGAEGEAPVLPEATSDMVSEATAVAAPAAAPSREPTEVATSQECSSEASRPPCCNRPPVRCSWRAA